MTDGSLMIGAFGLLASVELASLTVSIYNARHVGRDPEARARASAAEEDAQHAHTRLTAHLRDAHDQDVRHARPDGSGGEQEAVDA